MGDSKRFHLAALNGNLEDVEACLKRKVNIDSVSDKTTGQRTALMFASQRGNIEVMWSLVKHHADLSIKDIFGQTALIRAVTKGQVAAAEVLVKAKADVNDQDNEG